MKSTSQALREGRAGAVALALTVASAALLSGCSSHAVIDNLPYGASKGALDRIVQAAAWEFRDLGITANVVNPGATDTGWMTAGQMAEAWLSTPPTAKKFCPG